MNRDEAAPDPFDGLRGPGFMERFCASVFGLARPLRCVQVEISSFCGGRCSYCPHTTEGTHWPARHMAPETFARLWPVLRRSGRAHLQGWGEPMLHPRFTDFVSIARRAGCRVSSTSCGLAVNRQNAPIIVSSGLDTLAFSLTGTDEASNDARKGVPFHKVCSAIDMLNEALASAGNETDMEIRLAYLLLADRLEAARKLPALMQALDVPTAVVSTLDFIARPEHRSLAFSPDEPDKLLLASRILEEAAAEAAENGRNILYALPCSGPCPAGCREGVDSSLYVDASGLLSPCVYLNVPGMEMEKRLVFGSVWEHDAWEIWSGASFAAFRQGMAAGECPAACAGCVKRHEAGI